MQPQGAALAAGKIPRSFQETGHVESNVRSKFVEVQNYRQGTSSARRAGSLNRRKTAPARRTDTDDLPRKNLMGQAKQRGSRDERIAQAAEKAPATASAGYPLATVITHLVEHKEIAEFDSEITEKFDMHVGSMEDIRAERMQVGFRNSNGEIYRAIGITGLGEFLSFVGHLADIGLVDELAAETKGRGGYDAIFSA